MSVESQLDLLKYKIKILTTLVASDEHPFFMFLLDHDFTEEQTQTLKEVLYILNHRLNSDHAIEDEQSIVFYKEKVAEIKKRNSQLFAAHTNLLSESSPTFAEFVGIVEIILPKDVNPKYLLMALKKIGRAHV